MFTKIKTIFLLPFALLMNVSCSDDAPSEPDVLHSLINVSDELPGANCENGGVLVETGVDLNANDILEATEVNNSKYICNGQDGGAISSSTYLIINGDLTNEEAQAIIDNKKGANTQIVRIQNTTTLTEIDLSGITDLVDLVVIENEDLKILKAPELENIFNQLIIASNDKVSSLSFPELRRGELFIFTEEATTLDLPVSIPNIYLELEVPNTTYNFPFTELGSLYIYSENVQEISLPSLESANTLNLSGANLTSVNLPALRHIDSEFYIFGKVSNFSLPSLNSLGTKGGVFNLSNNSFTSNTVDGVLNKLANLTPLPSDWTIYLEQSPDSAPSGQGETDATTLRDNGNTVRTD